MVFSLCLVLTSQTFDNTIPKPSERTISVELLTNCHRPCHKKAELCTPIYIYLLSGRQQTVIGCFLFAHAGIAVERTRSVNLWGEPFALCGPDSTLLVVSEEAAPFGVRVGQSSSSARALCSGLIVLPYDRAAYEAAMQIVWNALAISLQLLNLSAQRWLMWNSRA